MYYLGGIDAFDGLEQAVVGQSLTQYKPGTTSATTCKKDDCDCWYSKAVNNIKFYNTANKSPKEYKTYKTNFALRYGQYTKCAQAKGIPVVSLDLTTPPPGVTFSAPGAGAQSVAAGGSGSALLDTATALMQAGGAGAGAVAPGATTPAPMDTGGMSMGEKIAVAVGGAVLLGGLVMVLTGKKKSLVPAVSGKATVASPVPGVIPATIKTRYITRWRRRKSSRRRR